MQYSKPPATDRPRTRYWGFLRAIDEGGLYPRGYGVAWREHYLSSREPLLVWCAPWPLGWICGALRWFYFAVRWGFNEHKVSLMREELEAARERIRSLETINRVLREGPFHDDSDDSLSPFAGLEER